MQRVQGTHASGPTCLNDSGGMPYTLSQRTTPAKAGPGSRIEPTAGSEQMTSKGTHHMATQSYDSALDFLPNAEAGNKQNRPVGLLETFKTFVRAINDGLKAQHDYKVMTSRGVPTAEAAKAAFSDHLKSN